MVLIINQFVIISIHALREEGDELFYDAQEAYGIFLSTPSARRATRAIVRDHECRGFLSTPSARRATWRSRGPRKTPSNFYPRPPRGGRLPQVSIGTLLWLFLSTPSARRATAWPCFFDIWGGDFYPRPPRGGRLPPWIQTDRAREFLSTPSARRATKRARHDRRLGIISIHALREEGDLWPTSRSRPSTNFYPRPPRGGRRFSGCGSGSPRRNFYPRPPRGGRPSHRHFSLMELYFYPRPPRGGRRQKQRQNLYFLINYTTFCTNLEEL